MTKSEIKRYVDKQDLVINMKRWGIIIAVVWLVIAVVLIITQNSSAVSRGLSMIYKFPFYVIAYVIAYYCARKYKEKEVLNQIAAKKGAKTTTSQRTTTRTGQSTVTQSQRSSGTATNGDLVDALGRVANNPMVQIMASYAVGSAVTKAVDKSGIIPSKNPNTERYAKYQEQARRNQRLRDLERAEKNIH